MRELNVVKLLFPANRVPRSGKVVVACALVPETSSKDRALAKRHLQISVFIFPGLSTEKVTISTGDI